MKMIKADLPKTNRNNLQDFIKSFIASDMETVEVINEGDYKSTSSMFNALKVTISRGIPGVRAVQYKHRVYLTKNIDTKE